MHCPSYHFSWNPFKSFFQIHKAKIERFFPLDLNFSCFCLRIKMVTVLPLPFINPNCISSSLAILLSHHTHTHTTVLLLVWNMSGSTRVSRYQKGKSFWDVGMVVCMGCRLASRTQIYCNNILSNGLWAMEIIVVRKSFRL